MTISADEVESREMQVLRADGHVLLFLSEINGNNVLLKELAGTILKSVTYVCPPDVQS